MNKQIHRDFIFSRLQETTGLVQPLVIFLNLCTRNTKINKISDNIFMDNKTVAELLPGFYKEYNLGMEGGKTSSSVRIEMTKKLVLYFPNFTARKKAVLKHDIHHLVTDYPSTFKGETEISAWE